MTRRSTTARIQEAGNYQVEGYAATFKKYLLHKNVYEQIDRYAFINADMSDIIMQYDHTGRILARTRNNTLDVNVNNKGLFIRANLSKSRAARELYEEIQQGLIDRMSWAFTIDDLDEETRNGIKIYTIRRIKKVYDVSAVSIPANEDTIITTQLKRKDCVRKLYIKGILCKD